MNRLVACTTATEEPCRAIACSFDLLLGASVSLCSRRARTCCRKSWFVTNGAQHIEAREDTDDGHGTDYDPRNAWAHGPVFMPPAPTPQGSRRGALAPAG
jgi:hypothetical protein